MLDTVLLVIAAICFGLAAFGVGGEVAPSVNLIALGLFCWVLTALV